MSEETEDLIFDYDGDASRESIWQAVDERAPELLLPGGRLQHIGRDCVLQAVDGGAMTATFTIVTRTKEANRHGNQVQIVESDLGRGLLTDFYQTNPIVLYDHGFGGVMLPIGLSADAAGKLSLQKTKSKVTATVWFSKLPHAELIYAAVDERILRMASIGYGVSKAMRLKPPKQTVLPEGVENWDRYVGFDFVETEMFEWSITPVGADRGSLRQCIERQRIHDVKLPPWLIQSFEPHAEPKTVQGRGADFTRRTIEQSGLVLEGPPDVVAKAFETLEPTGGQSGPAISVQSVEQWLREHVREGFEETWKQVLSSIGSPPENGSGANQQQSAPTTDHQPPATPEPTIDPAAIAEAYRQMVTPQEPTISVDAVLQAIGEQVSQAITAAVQPALDENKRLRAELQRMTGRLPS